MVCTLTLAHANLLKSKQESGIVEESGCSVEAMLRGYHIYRDMRTAEVNEELRCQREPLMRLILRCHCGEGKHCCRPRSEKDIVYLLVVSQKDRYNPVQGYLK